MPTYRPALGPGDLALAAADGGVEVRQVEVEHPDSGGVAFSLPHGSLLLEVAKQELHATMALSRPNRKHSARIGLVFYTHMNLHFPGHSAAVSTVRERQVYQVAETGVYPLPGGDENPHQVRLLFPSKYHVEGEEEHDPSLLFSPQQGRWTASASAGSTLSWTQTMNSLL